MQKKCALCGETKDVSEFHKNSRNKDGFHSYCKTCNSLKAKKFNSTEAGKTNVKNAQKKQFNSGYFKHGKGAINNMYHSAQKRGIEFKLNETQLKEWWLITPNVCSYCGISIEDYRLVRDFILNYKGNNWEISRFKKFYKLEIHAKIDDMTIDRMNNSIGYELQNITKSCWICNSLKSNFYTKSEIELIGKKVMDSILHYMKE